MAEPKQSCNYCISIYCILKQDLLSVAHSSTLNGDGAVHICLYKISSPFRKKYLFYIKQKTFCGDLFYIRLRRKKKFKVKKQAADEVPMLVEGNLTFGGKLACIMKKKRRK